MILLENIFDDKVLRKIKLIIDFIDSNNYNWGFVGGIPRDFFLYKKKLNTNEIDIVFLYPIDRLILQICEKFKDMILENYFHSKFITGKIVFKNGLSLDLITARNEHYPTPAHLPIVKPTNNLKEDIFRRDFSINTLVFKREKHPDLMFKILDITGGYSDILNSRIKILHTSSFIDDPTRIYRILRYKVRFNLQIDNNTSRYLINCLDYIKLLSNNRIFNELKKINNEKKFDMIYREFFELSFDPINIKKIEDKKLLKDLIKDLKILRKSIISFQYFFKNQYSKIKNKIDLNKVIFSFFLSRNFLEWEKYKNILSQDVYKFSQIWKYSINLISTLPRINSSTLKKIFLDYFNKFNDIEIFIILIFILFKLNRTDLKFILKRIFKKKHINPLKINPKFISSICKYYYDFELDLNTSKNLLSKLLNLYYLDKVRTVNQAIRYIRKQFKKESK